MRFRHLTVPWARERGLPVYPFDWVPSVADTRLLFGFDLTPPFIRPSRGFAGFLTFTDPDVLSRPLLYADAPGAGDAALAWADIPQERSMGDAARRLFLYRTFLQARRVALAASNHPGGTLLVLVGHLHKPDFGRILADYPDVKLVPPSNYGSPTDEEAAAHERPEDARAVATFNLLGIQSRTNVVDYPYLREVVKRLVKASPDAPEVRLFQARLGVLEGEISPAEAAESYRQICEATGPEDAFTWTGVADGSRLDTYFDPFGNLAVGQRAALERARELYKLGLPEEATALREELVAELPPQKAAQLRAYWDEHVR